MNKKGNQKYVHCNDCGQETEHTILENSSRDYDEYDGSQIMSTETVGYNFLRCNGCKNCKLEKYYTASYLRDQDGSQIFEYEYFPIENFRLLKEKRYNNIPENIEKLYHQVIIAFNDDLTIVCAIGLRTLLEAILDDKNIQGEDLNRKIINSNFIPENIRDNLHGIRFLGNDATHDFHDPGSKILEEAIYVIEDIMNLTYELDYKSKLMFSNIKNNRPCTQTP